VAESASSAASEFLKSSLSPARSKLNTPVRGNEMHEYPHLQWQAQVHRAKLKAASAHAASLFNRQPAAKAHGREALENPKDFS
jgi:hypothetical protein